MESVSFLPGIFEDYYSSSIIHSNGKIVGIAAKTSAGTPMTKYSITNYEDCTKLLGNDSDDIIVNRLVETILANGSPEVIVISVGDDNGYALAFDDLISSGVEIITSDSLSSDTLKDLRLSLIEAEQDGIRCIGIGSVNSLPHDELSALMSDLCCERLVVTLSPDISSAVSGIISSLEDITDPFFNVELKNIKSLDNTVSDSEEADFLIGIGISPIEEIAGKVRLVRCVSTSVVNNGAENDNFMQLNAALISDDVILYVTNVLNDAIKKSSDGGLSKDAIINIAVIALSLKCDDGIIDDFEIPEAVIDDISGALTLELSFIPVCCINHIKVIAHLNV